MSTIWDKGGSPDEAMMRFTARDDWRLDQRLLHHDLLATRAHVNGLMRVGVLSEDERASMVQALDELLARERQGAFVLNASHEDGHSAIEEALIEQLGDVGRKVHTGRSRNDQVLVALRLYQRDVIDSAITAIRRVGAAFLKRAKTDADVPMAGYTHLQRAVPSTAGFWWASFADQLGDSLQLLAGLRPLFNRSPLGGAAGYGVNIALDRVGVARELDFDDLAINPMASQAARGLLEVQLLSGLLHVMHTLRRFAWDVSLFCTAEFSFASLPASLTTGSSIMPNKRNPDVVELLRASSAVVQGAISELLAMLSLPSGYQRDLQLSKGPVMRAIDETFAALTVVPLVIEQLELNPEAMRRSVTPDTFATDRAVELTATGMPFRLAYQKVAGELQQLHRDPPSPESSIAARTSPGGPGDLMLDAIAARLG